MYVIAVVIGCCVFVAVGLVFAALDDRRRRDEYGLVEARAQASEALSKIQHPSSRHPFVPRPTRPDPSVSERHGARGHLRVVRGQR